MRVTISAKAGMVIFLWGMNKEIQPKLPDFGWSFLIKLLYYCNARNMFPDVVQIFEHTTVINYQKSTNAG